MRNYFAYIRVSTARQGEKGSSLPEQKALIEAYAKREGMKVPLQLLLAREGVLIGDTTGNRTAFRQAHTAFRTSRVSHPRRRSYPIHIATRVISHQLHA